MDINTATEQAYRNGYEAGKRDAEPKWIPVTERLPEDEGSYLVTSVTGKVYMAHWYTEKKCTEWYTRKAAWSHPNVTHWMPLPNPPTE